MKEEYELDFTMIPKKFILPKFHLFPVSWGHITYLLPTDIAQNNASLNQTIKAKN